jgi:hypothetical protein
MNTNQAQCAIDAARAARICVQECVANVNPRVFPCDAMVHLVYTYCMKEQQGVNKNSPIYQKDGRK